MILDDWKQQRLGITELSCMASALGLFTKGERGASVEDAVWHERGARRRLVDRSRPPPPQGVLLASCRELRTI